MAIKSISRQEFESYNIVRESSLSFIAKEYSWFADNSTNLLGIVLMDNIDKDWSYVVLEPDEFEQYRYTAGDVSLESQEIAESKLIDFFKSFAEKGQVSEILFEAGPIQNNESSQLIVTDLSNEIKKYLSKHPEKIYNLSSRQFEELIADILKDLGFDVELTKATRDGGRDIIASIRNTVSTFLAYIECKRYSSDNKVGVGIIREVAGVHYIRKPSKSMIVTSSFFTQDAVNEAKIMENQLDLKDYDDIKEWLKGYDK